MFYCVNLSSLSVQSERGIFELSFDTMYLAVRALKMNCEVSKEKVYEVYRKTTIEIIIVFLPNDLHPDHMSASAKLGKYR
jgi:predicted dehydrogenase